MRSIPTTSVLVVLPAFVVAPGANAQRAAAAEPRPPVTGMWERSSSFGRNLQRTSTTIALSRH